MRQYDNRAIRENLNNTRNYRINFKGLAEQIGGNASKGSEFDRKIAGGESELFNKITRKNLGEFDSIDEVQKYLGRPTTEPEFREFIYPKIVRDYKYFKDKGLKQHKILAELYDGYGYYDLIERAVAENGDKIEPRNQYWRSWVG